MALTGRLFLLPIRASLTAIISPSSPSSLSRSGIPFYGKFEPWRTWVKGLEPSLQNQLRRSSHWKLCVQRCHASNFCKSGRKLVMGSVFGASVIFGSTFLRPRVAYAMDGFGIWGDDHHLDLSNDSDAEEDPHKFLAFARKLLLPLFLFLTVMMNWDLPIILVPKVILILVGTKPSPFSIYLFIEKLRRQFMQQQPFLYKFKTLYAKKVEVDDYTFLCLAQVELKDQKFTLIGILGSWWVLPRWPCQGTFSFFRNKVLQK